MRTKLYEEVFPDVPWLQFIGFWITMVLCVQLATMILAFICPTATGSGVPNLKSVLGGVQIYKFLHWKVWVAKFFGLMAVLASGIGSGKEGPLIHMSAMCGYNLGKLPWFRNVMADPYNRKLL